MAIICAFSKRAGFSITSLICTIWPRAPAISNARSVSSSQLRPYPENMSASGLAIIFIYSEHVELPISEEGSICRGELRDRCIDELFIYLNGNYFVLGHLSNSCERDFPADPFECMRSVGANSRKNATLRFRKQNIRRSFCLAG